jgi:hypothetical protein
VRSLSSESAEPVALSAATGLLDRARQTCQAALGPDLCAGALADGEAMTLTDAVGYASAAAAHGTAQTRDGTA